ncbi:WhiB family transcriptional regulator [Aeromicrobium piscarium]|uniref:WhiB family transcriptional regulator n=1 Tax=Aeromicrobium piscarium TaxID=2590901 RepID=UPI003CCC786F
MASSSGWWLSDDAEEQEAAAWRCMQCPVITSCAGYIEHHGELAGVWAGITQGDRTKRTRKTGEPS